MKENIVKKSKLFYYDIYKNYNITVFIKLLLQKNRTAAVFLRLLVIKRFFLFNLVFPHVLIKRVLLYINRTS